MASVDGTERKTDRLEAFSDAVLAIAITLPVLDLKPPVQAADRRLIDQYAELSPQYGAYALSFVVIGLYWSYSHFSGKLWRKTDHVFNLLTLLFLAAVSVMPFPARPLLEGLGTAEQGTAARVYTCMLAVPPVLWTIRWLYGVRHGLLDPGLTGAYVQRASRRYFAGAAIAMTGAALCVWVDWRIGLSMVALVTLSHLLPPARPEFQAGREPHSDIEEADERPGD